VYTVLSEGDDQNDPIAEAARSFLDGHLVLSRQLADAGHYPAIDIERSISRVMHSVNPPDHLEAARVVRELWSAYQVSRDLIQVGAYVHGSDSLTDRAIAFHGPMRQLLRQQATDIVDFSHSVDALRELAQAAMLQSAPVAESSS
jgi:flagellum-specific ATP synthase